MALVCCCVAAGEGPAPFPALPEIDWSASKQSFLEEKAAVVLSGSAWVRFKNMKLEADHIVFFRQTREVYAEGHIRLRVGESEISAQAGYLNVNDDTGYLVEAVLRVSTKPDAMQGIGGTKKGKTEKREEKRDELRQLSPEKSTLSFIRARDPYGIYLEPAEDPQARTNLIIKAARLVRDGRLLYSADDAFVTTDDMVHPMYGVKAGRMEFHLYDAPNPAEPGKTQLKGKKVTAKRARLTILGVSLVPFPTITYDLVKGYPYFAVTYGKSTRWGPYSMSRYGYNLGTDEDRLFDPTRVYLDLDERSKRGPAAGFELDWQTGRRPPVVPGEKEHFERGEGHVRVYATDEIQTPEDEDILRARRDVERRIQPKIDGFPRRQFDANLLFARRRFLDNAGPPSFSLDQHRDEWRGMADFQQHQPLKRFAGLDNLQLDMRFRSQSDRDFMVEYFYDNYLKDNQPEGLASLRKPGDNYSVELLYRASPQSFDGSPPRSPLDYGDFTGYEPALTYSLVPAALPYGVYMSGEMQAARMTRDFDREVYDQSGFETGRAYAKVDFSRPLKWGPVNIVPHLGTQQQFYTSSRDVNQVGGAPDDGGSTSQGAITYGLDLTSRIYGTFPELENGDLGIEGMRHIIEPRISYRGVSDTTVEAERLLDFDPIDDLAALDKVTFALDQTFQARRAAEDGETRTFNFAGVDLALDYFPRSRDQERLLHGDALDLLRAEGFIRVTDVFKLDSGVGLRLEDGQVERTFYGITIDPQSRWRLRLEERFNFHDNSRAIVGSDQYRVHLDLKLSERWSVSYERVSEARRSVLVRKGRQVERVTVTRNYGPLDVSVTYALDRAFGDNLFFASVRPVAAYRNLVVPTQDLLVAAGEVSGAETEAPEERNFDPFDLLKKRKTVRRPSGSPGGPAGPPKAGSVWPFGVAVDTPAVLRSGP
ncbi:MAG: LPS assembly protein LptD [Planctomycetota bacterium]|nr:LPS assembly protein LptD [Planctomycetota bacterium]